MPRRSRRPGPSLLDVDLDVLAAEEVVVAREDARRGVEVAVVIVVAQRLVRTEAPARARRHGVGDGAVVGRGHEKRLLAVPRSG